jgi:hypothetical protein
LIGPVEAVASSTGNEVAEWWRADLDLDRPLLVVFVVVPAVDPPTVESREELLVSIVRGAGNGATKSSASRSGAAAEKIVSARMCGTFFFLPAERGVGA